MGVRQNLHFYWRRITFWIRSEMIVFVCFGYLEISFATCNFESTKLVLTIRKCSWKSVNLRAYFFSLINAWLHLELFQTKARVPTLDEQTEKTGEETGLSSLFGGQWLRGSKQWNAFADFKPKFEDFLLLIWS